MFSSSKWLNATLDTIRENSCEFISSKCLVNIPQGSGDVGAASATAQAAQCSAPLGNPGWDKHLELASGGRHSRMGWMGGNHLLSIDSELGCRHHGRLDNLQASPVYESQGHG